MTEMKTELSRMGAVEAATWLLGCEIIRNFPEGEARLRIVETEAYDESDAASHSYNGRTQRTDVMFGPAGHLYVYFTYGMHHCINVVVGESGYGAAVLIRGLQPVSGVEFLEARRPKHGVELTNGPAKVCEALAIDRSLNGHDLSQNPLRLTRERKSISGITTTTRIGISKDSHRLWRFYETDNDFVSKR
jgi:DNA-3-methyladenine glycosylase